MNFNFSLTQLESTERALAAGTEEPSVQHNFVILNWILFKPEALFH